MKNPIASWRDSVIAIAFFVLLALASLGMWAIRSSDKALATSVFQSSQRLEWTSSKARAACIVAEWKDARCKDCVHTVKRGIWIDSLLFVPFYSTLLALCCFWIGKHDGQGNPLLAPAVLFGYASWLAGILDWVENTGMLLQLRGSNGLAPLTGTAANLKWLIVIVVSLFVDFVAVRKFLVFCEDRVHRQEHGGG